jgi:phosphonoacetaldehyde dehydrogenase
MLTATQAAPAPAVLAESMRIAGERVTAARTLEVHNPYSGALVGTVPRASVDDIRRAFAVARAYKPMLSRYER